MTSLKKLAALVGAGALVFAMFGTAVAGEVVYATVDGHDASTNENNAADFWGEDCFKLNAGEGDLGSGVSTYELTAGYDKVIVKAGSTNQGDPNTLTIYNDVAAGETVWADSNGSNAFDEGDKNISHIIFCGPAETTTTTTTTDTTTTTTTTDTTTTTTTTDTFTSETGGETDAPSEPNTATIGTSTGAPADGAWLLVIALGVLLASIVVLTPARARR
ncbi:MAG: hypothetical protein ABIZ52_03765 [Candidatus Limnocylindrales bacterium]